eukprot:838212-Amphidinium_carterae.2
MTAKAVDVMECAHVGCGQDTYGQEDIVDTLAMLGNNYNLLAVVRRNRIECYRHKQLRVARLQLEQKTHV